MSMRLNPCLKTKAPNKDCLGQSKLFPLDDTNLSLPLYGRIGYIITLKFPPILYILFISYNLFGQNLVTIQTVFVKKELLYIILLVCDSPFYYDTIYVIYYDIYLNFFTM